MARFPRLALFDLDGTLLDSAPDMVATVNRMRGVRGRGPMPLEELRPHVSRGARAMSAAAFPELGGEVPPELIREFLDSYELELGRSSKVSRSCCVRSSTTARAGAS
jgi:phosphoglycolate phosphatase-like HAD superfamily hydrolase